MVRARSCSFRRTIKGRLWWWPPHHCSVPPLPPATLVGLISELHRNTSSTPLPPTQPALLSLSLPTSTMCFLPQHNQSPTMLHTRSMFQANHITHAPVLEVMSCGHHKDLRGFMSASFGTIRNTSLLVICSFYYHMLFMITPYMFMFCFSSNLLLLNSLSLVLSFFLAQFWTLLLHLDLQNSRHPSRERRNLQVEANASHDFGPDISVQIPSLTHSNSITHLKKSPVQ